MVFFFKVIYLVALKSPYAPYSFLQINTHMQIGKQAEQTERGGTEQHF